MTARHRRGRRPATCVHARLQHVMFGHGPDVLLCGRVVANVVGDSDTASLRFRRLADEVAGR